MVQPHVLDVVEAAYGSLSPAAWLGQVLGAARPLLDRGDGVLAYTFDASNPYAIELGKPLYAGAGPEVWRAMQLSTDGLELGAVRRTYLGSRPFGTVAQRFGGRTRPIYLDLARRCYRPNGFGDLLVLHVVDAEQRGCLFAAPLGRSRPVGRKELGVWARVAAHVRAGYRLARGPRGAGSVGIEQADAVLTPEGKLLHAKGAREAAARSALQRAAVAMDRARTSRAREKPDQALELWEELLSGRFTLVDRFDTDGRRLFVALRNDALVARHSQLTAPEREVIQGVLRGAPNKTIARERGVSEATVSEQLARALSKLNLRSTRELVELAPLLGRE